MPQPVKPSIREVLLQEIKAHEAQTRTGGTLQQSSVLDAAAMKLSGYDHEAILTRLGSHSRAHVDLWWCRGRHCPF